MSALRLLPDIEAFLVAYLSSRLPNTHVGTKQPSTTAAPWIRITLLDPRDISGTNIDYLIDYLVQLDCYAGSQGSTVVASGLVRTARAHLLAMEGKHDDLVVSKVEFTGMRPQPDTSEEPAMERYILDASITAHV